MRPEKEPRVGRLLGRVALRSAAKPGQTVVVIVLLTVVVGFGMTQLETDSDLLKLLPKDNPHTEAAQEASSGFRGFYDFVTFFYGIDPEKCERVTPTQLPNRVITRYGSDGAEITCGNVLHEAYVRGMDEIWMFLQEEIQAAEYSIDFAQLIKVVNWTNDGYFGDSPDQSILLPLLSGNTDQIGRPPDDEAYSMPDTSPLGSLQYYAAFQGVLAADEAATDTVGSDLTAGRTLIFFNTTDAGLSRVELGKAVYAGVDAYGDAIRACDEPELGEPCKLQWNVFSSEGLAVRGVSTLDAHASEVTQRDISILAPIIIWAIILILYVAFRDVRVILVAAANLLIAFLWTAGLMGWLKIPFSALNMTIVPLILGVGIDYGIHMVSEYLEHKGDRMADTEAFKQAGKRAGIAMAIATVTTVVGLVLMVFSPSILMGQLGIVSSIALIVTFVFTMTLIPAVLTLTARDSARARPHKGSSWVPKLATQVAKRRWMALGLVGLLSVGALVNMQNLEVEAFGNPELNYPPGDRVRDDQDWISREFFGGQSETQTNYLIIRGDLTEPAVHKFLDAVEANLQADPTLEAFNTASLTRIVRGWLAINQGTPDAVVNQFVLGNMPMEELRDFEYPTTKEEVRRVFDELFASPFANFATVLLNRDYDLGMVAYDTRQKTNFAESERVWDASLAVIAQTRAQTGVTEDMLQVHMFGNNAFSYLFITEEAPWVQWIGYVSFGTVIILIALLTRNLRATACTAVVMGATSLWWLGALPLAGIGLSVGLMLPLVFIMAIGSDDAIHLIWNMELTHDRHKVYRFVGQAVLLTTITTMVAFGIFTQQTDLLVTRTLLATTIAIGIMWLATMLVVPVFYPVKDPLDVRPTRPPRPTAATDPHPARHASTVRR